MALKINSYSISNLPLFAFLIYVFVSSAAFWRWRWFNNFYPVFISILLALIIFLYFAKFTRSTDDSDTQLTLFFFVNYWLKSRIISKNFCPISVQRNNLSKTNYSKSHFIFNELISKFSIINDSYIVCTSVNSIIIK